MSKKEEFGEIFDLLKSVAEHKRQPILESELREMTKRVFEYRAGPELYRIIMEISNAKYFPAASELENQVRIAKGLKPLKGLTSELIDKFEEEAIVSGQNPKNAKAGAEIARRTLRKPILKEKTQEDVDEACAGIAAPARIERQAESGLAMLENFDDPSPNLLDELESF